MRYAYAVELVALAVSGRDRGPTSARIARVAPHLELRDIDEILNVARNTGECLFAAPPILARRGYQILRLSRDGRSTQFEWLGKGQLIAAGADEAHEQSCRYIRRAVLYARFTWGRELADTDEDWKPLHPRKHAIAPAPTVRSTGTAQCAVLTSRQQLRHSGTVRAYVLLAMAITLLCPADGSATESRPVYTVQVGSFARETNAKSMRNRLDDHYTDVTILSDRVGEKAVYRVLSGRFATQRQADVRRDSLTGLGFDTLVRRFDASPMRAVTPPPYRPAWKLVADQVEAGRRLPWSEPEL